MRILVTGGAGFIGSHIVEYHLAKGDQVYAVDDLSTGTKKNIEPFISNQNFHFIEADILTWSEIQKTVTWADRIYHMAAIVGMFRVIQEPVKVLATNVAGCERILRAVATAPKPPRTLIASSSEVYGSNKKALKENQVLKISSGAKNRCNYSISKLADEAFGLSYASEFKLPITILRVFNMIGPRQTGRYGMVVPRFIQQALNNEPITVFGNDTQTRSFCDVRDCVELLDLLAENPASIGEVVNLGNNKEISIKALAKKIKTASKSKSSIIFTPYIEAYGEKVEEIQRRYPDLKKLAALTPSFKYQWTLDKSIKDLIMRHQKNH